MPDRRALPSRVYREDCPFQPPSSRRSHEDARAVADLASRKGLPCILGDGDVAAHAREKSLSVEEAARELRYKFLFDQARVIQAQAVAVGHTADDQVETVLMHLLRGAGLAGLKGMAYRSVNPAWDARIPLVRPLLGVWREETEAYCAGQGLHPVIDASNRDTAYFRNRMRHELIPFLESYNPRLRQAIWRTSFSLAGDFEIVQAASRQGYESCLREAGDSFVALDIDKLNKFSSGIQRNVIRLALARVRPELRDLDFDTVERSLEFLRSPARNGSMQLMGGLSLRIEADRLYFLQVGESPPDQGWPRIDLDEPGRLPEPGRLEIGARWVLVAEWVEATGESLIEQARTTAPYEAWLDGKVELFPLTVRRRAPGDRFQPLGMEGRWVKLSDFFVNVKLPRRARAAWPLVCSEGQIAWIPGYRPAHSFRITDSTQRALHLQLEKVS